MQKVLFLINTYLQHVSANGICDGKLIRDMQKSGKYDITCLTYRFFDQCDEETVDGVRIVRFEKSKFDTLYRRLLEKKKKGIFARVVIALAKFKLRLQQILTIPFYPYTYPLACRKYAKKAYQLYRKNGYDCVITEHHGFDTLWAGAYLKKKIPSCKTMTIFWDGLSGGVAPKYLSERYFLKRSFRAENKLLCHYDRVVFLESYRKHYAKHADRVGFMDKVQFLELPNVDFSQAQWGTTCELKQELCGLYCGIMDGLRSPAALIEIVREMRDPALRFVIVGDCEFSKEFERVNAELGYTAFDVKGRVPYTTMPEYYRQADLLINIGNATSDMVPSKIFEYISHQKPIISFYSSEQDSSLRYLQKYDGILLLDSRKNTTELKVEMCSFLNKIRTNTLFSQSPEQRIERLRALFFENTTAPYLKLLESWLEEEKA